MAAGVIHVSLRREPANQGKYSNGLSDYQADDPLGEPYTDKPFYPRNWTPPNMRPSVPEVRRFYKVTRKEKPRLLLREGIEWMFFYLFQIHSGMSESAALPLYQRHMRTDAGYTNKVAWNSDSPRRSFVLGLNPTKEPMELLGIVCPGGNVFRKTGSPARQFDDDGQAVWFEPVWVLDYDWLERFLTKDNALEFARTLPPWLYNVAKIVHPVKIGDPVPGAPNGVFKVINWDGDFRVPNMSSDGKQEMVDGFHCRETWLKQVRLQD
jgi:hypothetical protein